MAGDPQTTAERVLSTRDPRDPRHAGMKAAILVRLHDRLKIEAEFSEVGHEHWRTHRARANLLRDVIAEIEGLQES